MAGSSWWAESYRLWGALDRTCAEDTGAADQDALATGSSLLGRNEEYTHCRYMRTSTQIARWGNSLGLRLPKALASEARIGEGDTVEVSVKDGTITVRASPTTYTLQELVGKITPRNRHSETGWGKPTGSEPW